MAKLHLSVYIRALLPDKCSSCGSRALKLSTDGIIELGHTMDLISTPHKSIWSIDGVSPHNQNNLNDYIITCLTCDKEIINEECPGGK